MTVAWNGLMNTLPPKAPDGPILQITCDLCDEPVTLDPRRRGGAPHGLYFHHDWKSECPGSWHYDHEERPSWGLPSAAIPQEDREHDTETPVHTEAR